MTNDDRYKAIWDTQGNVARPVHCHYCGKPWSVDLIVYNYTGEAQPWWCSEDCKDRDTKEALGRLLLDEDEDVPF